MTWGYIAGFFDGEGSICRNGKGYRITVPQTDEDVLMSIRDFVGSGHVIKVKRRKSHWKESWVFYIAKQVDVFIFLTRVIDDLVVKRPLAKKVLILLKAYLSKKRVRTTRRQDRLNSMLRLRSRGHSYNAIGKILELDRGYVRRLLLKKYRWTKTVGRH